MIISVLGKALSLAAKDLTMRIKRCAVWKKRIYSKEMFSLF